MAVGLCLVAISVLVCWKTLSAEGVILSLNGKSFSSNATSRISITDIPLGANLTTALACRSELRQENVSEWTNGFLQNDGENPNTDLDKRIRPTVDNVTTRGWDTFRDIDENDHRVHYLRRWSNNAEEGYYTCRMHNDTNPARGLYILYPIKFVHVTIEVVLGTTFRVRCIYTGGRALEMTVSGPDGYSSDLSDHILPVGDRRWTGSDEYTATSDTLEGRDGHTYNCTVTNVALITGSARLTAALFPPNITSLEQTAPTTVTVKWSPPTLPPGPIVTSYKIHYRHEDGSDAGSVEVVANTDKDRANITKLTSGGVIYLFKVQAISHSGDVLNGVSQEKSIRLDIAATTGPAFPSIGVIVGAVGAVLIVASGSIIAAVIVKEKRTKPDEMRGMCENPAYDLPPAYEDIYFSETNIV
jgi:hypothetical protein